MKFLFTILLICPLLATAQQKWWKPTKNELIAHWFMIGSGMAKGYHEAINYKGFGKGNDFVDITTSWKRKWKNYDAGDKRERFLGSSTVFVVFTDANHLSAFLNNSFLIVGTAFNFQDLKSDLKQFKGWQKVGYIVVRKLAPYMLRSLIFETQYKYLQ